MIAQSSEIPAGLPMFRITDTEFRQLRALIYTHTGIALTDHKRALVCARLAKRLRYHRFRTFTEYYQLLTERDPEGVELVEMINCITTNKTDFFRESHHFDFLKSRVIPEQRELTRGAARKLRIWSAGTSTGEEAYSVAMTLRDTLPPEEMWDAKVLATDIDTRVLEHGERGVYSAEQASTIPKAALQRYFYQGFGDNAGYVKVKPVIRDLITFRRLNLMEEWPMRGPFDVIFCRNVVIYFDRETQRRLVQRLIHLLRPGGYLFLGHSESLLGGDSAVSHIGQSIYQYVGRV
jgi:chemotaxis protein methyltransferase CheR